MNKESIAAFAPDSAGHTKAAAFGDTESDQVSGDRVFLFVKRFFDVALSLLLLPLLAFFAAILLLINPTANAGPLFFTQKRMGRDCVPFTAVKFRTMRPASEIKRSATCDLEVDRITPLGHFLRKSRIDELPQIINVLRGDMSLIGPRPDYYEHACHFLEVVPGYRERHAVRPGISGLAQTEFGYASGTDATKRKVRADLIYIRRRSFRMESWIIWRTLVVIFMRGGA